MSQLLALGTKVLVLTAFATILFSANIAFGTPAQLAMIGQQYFADGTGIAYFNDGTTEEFEHTLTADEGYYYDESTPFYLDEVPGIGNNNGSIMCAENINTLELRRQASMTNSTTTMPPSSADDGNRTLETGNITTITIIRGASLLSDKSRAVDPNAVVTINVNDIVTWQNQDTTNHWLTSPPMSIGGNLPYATFMNTFISPNGGTYSCTFTEPGGYHYTLGSDIKGAVMVEGNTTTNSTEQVQQPPSASASSFSQQLQSQQQEQNEGEASVSIVPGSSTLTTDAFSPNPVQVSVGSTVTWTNDDTQPHTVTSGENVTPDGKFDSGIMAPAATLEHTFTEAGDYPYFCLLHPNQVGTISVTTGAGSSATSLANNTTDSSSTMGNTGGPLSEITEPLQDLFGGGNQTSSVSNTAAINSTIANDNSTTGPLSEITEPLQDLFGGGNQTTGGGGSSSTTNTDTSTFSSSPPPSSSGSSSRCPDGYHRSPSGDCERVTDTRGMPRCPDGYHRSPSGYCEYVG
jgi:plastocyanin